MSNTKTVVNCYELLALSQSEIDDYTEGMYEGNPSRPYHNAQKCQVNYLLDEIGCKVESVILDIGCGNSTLLEAVRERGAVGIGITLSPAQVAYGHSKGLDVRLLNYKDIGDEWTAKFDGVVANGSMEHFVQVKDALEGRQDDIYENMFRICREILKEGGLFTTTVIHIGSVDINPRELLKHPLLHGWGSSAFHYGLLTRSFGGFYPQIGQLKKCAKIFFELIKEVDGTEDYRLTSESWITMTNKSLRSNVPYLLKIFGRFLRHPYHTALFGLSLLIAKSWNWQFRGSSPPMRLVRQTWVRK
ncbi:MAG TPA: class I SAM-dependent methyltransferase [Candidatus Paceibacterota bacterium]